jgi:hypothetical protein
MDPHPRILVGCQMVHDGIKHLQVYPGPSPQDTEISADVAAGTVRNSPNFEE